MVKDVISVSGTANLTDAVKLLIDHKISGLPVLDEQEKLIGVIGERDLILALDLIGAEVQVRDVMKPDPIFVDADRPLVELFEMFRSQGLRRVLICDPDKKLLGTIGRRDLLRVHMNYCMEQNQFQRSTMRRQSSCFELGPLVAQRENVKAIGI